MSIQGLLKFEPFNSGIWQTVSTKEQREQQKREKKKQDEEDAAAANMSESVMVTKPEKNDPLSALFRPPGNISAIAKGTLYIILAKKLSLPW